jgi:hypothetical protein
MACTAITNDLKARSIDDPSAPSSLQDDNRLSGVDNIEVVEGTEGLYLPVQVKPATSMACVIGSFLLTEEASGSDEADPCTGCGDMGRC